MFIRKIFRFIKRKIRVREYIIHYILNKKKTIFHNGIEITLCTPNEICDYRAREFSVKEPDTLEWIDSIGKDSVIWDIGANVGVYSIYAAKRKNAKVWAFEPSFFNLEMLARNINLNGLQDQIKILPLALNNRIGFSQMRHSTISWGGALSTFEKDYGYDGKKLKEIFSYSTFGVNLDFIRKSSGIPFPDYIKLDVDGIEHLILEGGVRVLRKAKEILVEVNEGFEEQRSRSEKVLKKCGFKLKSKGEYHDPSIRLVNQIWKKAKKR